MTIGGREFRWGERTYVMGIVNCTPDSFAGDGLGYDVAAAVRRALRMRQEGADIIDVGGESTRPGYQPVPAEEELRRVLPVVRALASELDVPISIDTAKAQVAMAALEAGASLVNDVTGLKGDPDMARMLADYRVPAVVMHNQRGRPFNGVVADVLAGWEESFRLAEAAGVPRDVLIVDPGFNFGWRPEHALEMLRRLGELRRAAGRPLLIGTSRKSVIGLVLGGLPVEDRLEGTAATVALAIAQGADIVRVHDVKEMARVARMADAVVRGWQAPEGAP
ncbi:MAG TPA: dihydropteroate synthase [Dehalococcoidia bacterium]|nr:dihydropteroate synthase [Dehalococcoidia bacterium]